MASAQKAVSGNNTNHSTVVAGNSNKAAGNIYKLTARTNDSEYRSPSTDANTALQTYLDANVNADVDGGL